MSVLLSVIAVLVLLVLGALGIVMAIILGTVMIDNVETLRMLRLRPWERKRRALMLLSAVAATSAGISSLVVSYGCGYGIANILGMV